MLFLKLSEVQKRLNLSMQTLHELIKNGELQAIVVNIHHNNKRPEYRVAEDELERFTESRKVVARTKVLAKKRVRLAKVKDHFASSDK